MAICMYCPSLHRHQSVGLLPLTVGECLDSTQVLLEIVFVEGQGLLLRRAVDIGLVFEQFLDPQQQCLDC